MFISFSFRFSAELIENRTTDTAVTAGVLKTQLG